MTAPKIEILHERDPDYECGVRLWIDGVEVTSFVYEDIDPGRGYERADWDERVSGVTDPDTPYTDSYRAAVLGALEASSDSKYIEG